MTERYRKVLIVEDDDTLCRIIERNLSVRGCQPRIAPTVGEAEAAIAVQRPDLILLDINLPDRTGWELLRGLQGRGITIPTVIISATRVTADRVARVSTKRKGSRAGLRSPRAVSVAWQPSRRSLEHPL